LSVESNQAAALASEPMILVEETSGSGTEDTFLVSYNQVAGNRYIVQTSRDLKIWETIDEFEAQTSGPMTHEIYTDLATEPLFIRLIIE